MHRLNPFVTTDVVRHVYGGREYAYDLGVTGAASLYGIYTKVAPYETL